MYEGMYVDRWEQSDRMDEQKKIVKDDKPASQPSSYVHLNLHNTLIIRSPGVGENCDSECFVRII